MYKYSFYNIEIPIQDEDNVYIYNTRSGAIIKLKKDDYDFVKCATFENETVCQYLPSLLQQGIIINKEKDELNEILAKQKISQYQESDTFSLIIAPTLACNYKCVYCFEGDNDNCNTIMSEQTMTDIVLFLEKAVANRRLTKKLKIRWFGGEPLLAFNKVILPLSQRLIEFCENSNIVYQSGIITNGYLLNEDIISALIDKCNVNEFQITLDGRKENYNRLKRPPRDGYEKVKENLFLLSGAVANEQKKIRVKIRINTAQNNADDGKLLFDEIKSDERYKNNFDFYLGRIRGCGDEHCRSLGLSEFEKYEKEFNAYIGKNSRFLESKKVWCNQFTVNSLCIGVNGEIYKCEHDFGVQNRVIGHIKTGLYYNEYFYGFMEQSIAKRCKDCKIFPICLGGCPNERYFLQKGYSCEFTYDKVIGAVKETIARNGKGG